MAEYIEREKAKDELLSWAVCINHPEHLSKEDAMYVLDRLPTADVAEVVHGHWVLLDECSNAGVYCSVCHKKVYKECYANCKPESNYCPNCGAKMDGGNNAK